MTSKTLETHRIADLSHNQLNDEIHLKGWVRTRQIGRASCRERV